MPAQTQGKIERWHQMLRNRVLHEYYYLPAALEELVAALVEHYNRAPADVYFGRGEVILAERVRINCQDPTNRRPLPLAHAARLRTQMHLPL